MPIPGNPGTRLTDVTRLPQGGADAYAHPIHAPGGGFQPRGSARVLCGLEIPAGSTSRWRRLPVRSPLLSEHPLSCPCLRRPPRSRAVSHWHFLAFFRTPDAACSHAKADRALALQERLSTALESGQELARMPYWVRCRPRLLADAETARCHDRSAPDRQARPAARHLGGTGFDRGGPAYTTGATRCACGRARVDCRRRAGSSRFHRPTRRRGRRQFATHRRASRQGRAGTL